MKEGNLWNTKHSGYFVDTPGMDLFASSDFLRATSKMLRSLSATQVYLLVFTRFTRFSERSIKALKLNLERARIPAESLLVLFSHSDGLPADLR